MKKFPFDVSRRMRMELSRARRLSTFVVLHVALIAPHAWAEQPPRQSVPATSSERTDARLGEARESFRRGTALARQARWDEALDSFQRSYDLKPHPITSYNLGYCERAIGHYTRARKLLMRALVEKGSGQDEKLPDPVAELARNYLAEIDRRIAHVEVVVDPPFGRLLVDGRPIEQEKGGPSISPRDSVFFAGTEEVGAAGDLPSARFSLLIDPGTHVFVLSRSNAPDTVVTRRFEPGSASTFHLRATSGVSAIPSGASLDAQAKSSTFNRQWAYLAVGAGAAGLAVGAVAGLAALRKRSALIDVCGERMDDCPRSQQSNIDALKLDSDIATVGFAVGGAAMAGGLIALVLFKHRDESQDNKTPSVRMTVPSLGSVALSGQF